jgi:hypothetical protein
MAPMPPALSILILSEFARMVASAPNIVSLAARYAPAGCCRPMLRPNARPGSIPQIVRSAPIEIGGGCAAGKGAGVH